MNMTGLADKKKITEQDVDAKQLAMGVKVEMEHTQDAKVAKQIALDHLAEIPDYYTRLKEMEDEAEKSLRKNGDEEDEEEATGPLPKDAADRVRAFLAENPKPSDDQFHELAEDMGVSPHKLEEVVYAMAAKNVKKSGLDALDDMVKAMFIGPRGGKWADAKHTIPYDEKKHGGKGDGGKAKPKRTPVKDEGVERRAKDAADMRAGKAAMRAAHAAIAGDGMSTDWEQAKQYYKAAAKAYAAVVKRNAQVPSTEVDHETVGRAFDKLEYARKGARDATKAAKKQAAVREKQKAIPPSKPAYGAGPAELSDYHRKMSGWFEHRINEAAQADMPTENLKQCHEAHGYQAMGYQAAADGDYDLAAASFKNATAAMGRATGDPGNPDVQDLLALKQKYDKLAAAETPETPAVTPVMRQGNLFERSMDSLENYVESGMEDLSKGGPFIGPRGGKWADAKHTIPWKDQFEEAKLADDGILGKPALDKDVRDLETKHNLIRKWEKAGTADPRKLKATVSSIKSLTQAIKNKIGGRIKALREQRVPDAEKQIKDLLDTKEQVEYDTSNMLKFAERIKPAGSSDNRPIPELTAQLASEIPGARVDASVGDVVLPGGKRILLSRMGGETYYVVWEEGKKPSVDLKFSSVADIAEKFGAASTKKSLTGGTGMDNLEDYLVKAGACALPAHKEGMGHSKSDVVDGGSADGGNLDGKGKGAGGAGMTATITEGVSATPDKKQKLSEDDEEDEKQMSEHKKPIERSTRKSLDDVHSISDPNSIRRDTAMANARAARQLQKSDDVTVGVGIAPPAEPEQEMIKANITRQGEMVSRSDYSDQMVVQYLEKSESLYTGQAPTLERQSTVMQKSELCKSCNKAKPAMLATCPSCGAGAHQVGVEHYEEGQLTKSEQPERPRLRVVQHDDLYLPNGVESE